MRSCRGVKTILISLICFLVFYKYFNTRIDKCSIGDNSTMKNPAQTNVSDSVLLKFTEKEELFDLAHAAKLWDKQVGCSKFREKHKHVIEMYSKGGSETWPHSPSFQNLTKLNCNDMQLRHVSVWVKEPNFLKPNWMEGFHFCPRCGLSCQFTWNRDLEEDVDVQLYIYSDPTRNRRKPGPLNAKLDVEPYDWWYIKSTVDISISYEPHYDLQSTYARTKERQHLLSKDKLKNVMIYRASSNCEVGFRNRMVKDILSHFSYHSFGKCDNNVGGVNREFLFFPHCENGLHRNDEGFGWPKFANCIMSHYKFVLAIENHLKNGYVTEKLFMPLESRSVPIYYGAPDVENFMPPHSFINIRNFKTTKELVDYVMKVHNDPVLYMEYLAWRRCGVPGNYIRSRELSMDTLPCRLCELASFKGGRNAPVEKN